MTAPALALAPFPRSRPRRLRSSAALRRLTRETRLSPASLIAPLFVCAGDNVRRAIEGLPGHFVQSVEHAVGSATELRRAGIGGVLLFGVAERKDESGSEAWAPDGAVALALRALRTALPDLALWADVCLCAYTSHGHCGVVTTGRDGSGHIDNDRTLPLLARVAVNYAAAGADVIAPSDMMDGRVGHVRTALDEAGYADTAICSYAVKYASSFYGPFRNAADSRPIDGDRRGYQMDAGNADEALREVALDLDEGADLIMVKPALAYLDVVRRVKHAFRAPTAAFNVSGEYAMVHAAADRGWIDARAAMLEILTAIRRAGADLIVTYFAREAAAALRGDDRWPA